MSPCRPLLPLMLALPACVVCFAGDQARAQAPPNLAPGQTAVVRGTVSLGGTPPAPAMLDMSADPKCGSNPTESEELVASERHIANALVYIKEARDKTALTPNAHMPPTTPATIKTDGCRFHPHVLAMMTGQAVTIVNLDSATHKIYALVRADAEFDLSLAPGKSPTVIVPKQARLMMPLASDQHPWMRMYISIFPHPFFAVTGTDGRFEITGLPPGRYTISVVHEKLGEEARQIEVGPKQEKIVDFTFNAASIH